VVGHCWPSAFFSMANSVKFNREIHVLKTKNIDYC
jgi:hypothetical protein